MYARLLLLLPVTVQVGWLTTGSTCIRGIHGCLYCTQAYTISLHTHTLSLTLSLSLTHIHRTYMYVKHLRLSFFVSYRLSTYIHKYLGC